MKNILILIFISFQTYFYSQESGTSRIVENFQQGDVLSSSNGRFYNSKIYRCNNENDYHVFAVYNESSDGTVDNTFVREGIVKVRYNDTKGIIKKGDFLTSSTIIGTAEKALKPTYVIGIALEDSNFEKDHGLIEIKILFQYVNIQ